MDKQKRTIIQFCSALLQNANLTGFAGGTLYRGPVKQFCVPGLNCYSCPGALGACPLGSLQAFLSGRPVVFPFYVLGIVLFFGTLLGRAVCGFLCPFGLIQELLFKIPIPRKKAPTLPGDRWLRKLKYAVLLVFVIALPLALENIPAFCKWLCPVGALEGSIPLTLLSGSDVVFSKGWLYFWKLALLTLVLLASAAVFRPFCRYLCPLGAFYGCMNRVSIYRASIDVSRCTGCGSCAAVCPMQTNPLGQANGAECIRCGACEKTCPSGALHFTFHLPLLPESACKDTQPPNHF